MIIKINVKEESCKAREKKPSSTMSSRRKKTAKEPQGKRYKKIKF